MRPIGGGGKGGKDNQTDLRTVARDQRAAVTPNAEAFQGGHAQQAGTVHDGR